MHVHVLCVEVQKTTSSDISQVPPTSLETLLFTGLQLAELARLASQGAPGILSLTLQCWNYNVPPCQLFMWVLEIDCNHVIPWQELYQLSYLSRLLIENMKYNIL